MEGKPNKLEEVRAEADTLLQEVNRLLNNREYTFTDDSGEAWMKQLKDVANRCRHLRLSFLERQLEAAARQVDERREK